METPIQKQGLPQMEDNIQTLCKVSCLGTVVCVLSRTSIKMKWPELLTFVWTGLKYTVTFWHLNLYFIYLLIIICMCTTLVNIYLQHHHWYHIHTYIHTHHITFFWIAVYLWRLFYIHIKAIRPYWYLGSYKLTTDYFLLSDLIDINIANRHIVCNA